MRSWSDEIQELEKWVQALSDRHPELEKELSQLIEADNDVVVLVYSRRSLEILVRNICEREQLKISDTIPLKGIIDKLNKEQKVPSNIITAMLNLNSSSVFGAHPKEFDSGQVRTALINLASILKWFINYRGIYASSEPLTQSQPNPEPLPPKKSIIVLPFENISPDPEQEYFSDGLTEEIITDLSHIHDLLVISRSSAMTFKGSKLTLKEIAQKVNVTHVLEGSVRKAGNNLRITAQLIDAESDTHLWAEKFDGVLEDVFDIQEKVSRSIAEKLRIQLSVDETKQLAERKYDSVLVYQYYFKAIENITSFSSEDSISMVIRDLKNATEIIGEQSLIFSAIAFAYWSYINVGFYKEEYVQKSEFYAQKALQLDPNSSMPNVVLGFIHHLFHRDWHTAYDYFKKAFEIDSNNVLTIAGILNIYVMAGKMETSRPLVQKMDKIDPLSFATRWYQAAFNYYSGKFDLALAESKKTIGLFPDNPYGLYEHCVILAYNDKTQEAINMADKICGLKQGTIFEKLALMLKYALLEKPEEMNKVLSKEDEETIAHDSSYSNQLVGFFCIANQKEKAYEWLEITINNDFVNYPFFYNYCPFYQKIRNEPRFKLLMQKVKHEWENFEV